MPYVKNDRQTLAGFLVVGLLLAALFALHFVLDTPGRDLLLKEGGLVETVSAISYFLCAALMIAGGGRLFLAKHYPLVALVVLFGLREMDFDKKFTTLGIFKSKFFFSHAVPLHEKLIGALVVGFVIFIVIQALRGRLRDLWIGCLDRSTIALGVVLAGGFMVISKTLDGLARKLKGIGIQLSSETSIHTSALEEILEMGIPLILILTTLAYFKQKTVSTDQPV